jgi:hypothetical protein
MRNTKAIAIAVLAVVIGVSIAYSPMFLFQAQYAIQTAQQGAGPDAFKNGTNGTFDLYAGNTQTNESGLVQENTIATVANLASSSGGFVAGIVIGLAAAAFCYFIIKRKTMDQKMLRASSP